MSRSLVRELERATHHVGAYLTDALREMGITQAEAHVLALLGADGPLTVRALVSAFGHRPSTLTSVLGRLEGRGMVGRRIDESDRRSFVIFLTPAGTEAASQVAETVAALESAIVRHLSEAAVEGFFATAAAISDGPSTRTLRVARDTGSDE